MLSIDRGILVFMIHPSRRFFCNTTTFITRVLKNRDGFESRDAFLRACPDKTAHPWSQTV